MNGKILLCVVFAAALAAGGLLRAQDEKAHGGASGDAAAPAAASGAGSAKPRSSGQRAGMGVDKAGVEAYLRGRLSKIKAAHKARLDFISKESAAWESFWSKVKDERELFEVRIARQRLDAFESMASLERSAHAATIANFEKMQMDVVKAFEGQQKQKMAEFFAERERKLRDFSIQQEKSRADFAADVEASWQALKIQMHVQPPKK